MTSSQPAHQYKTQHLQQYQTTTHHVTNPAAATAAAGTSTHLPSANPAEHTMAATRQQVDTSVPGAPYHHPSSSIEQPTTSNGIPATSQQRHEDLPAHYYEDIDSDDDDVADSSRGPVMCKTIVLTAHGGLDKLQVEERARREPSNGEVLVKVGTCLSVRASVHPSMCRTVCLSVWLSTCLSNSMSLVSNVESLIRVCTYLSFCLSVCGSVCLSVCLHAHMFYICLPISLSV